MITDTNGGPAPIVLALDASTTAVGWCVGQGEEYLASGAFEPDGESAGPRIQAIAKWAWETLCLWDPDLVALEEPTGDHGNRRVDRLLARVGGVIEGICQSAEPPVEVVYVHPMHIKQTLFHKNATVAAAHYARKDEVSGDEADAIGAWHVAVGQLRAHEFNKLMTREETR